MRSFLGLMALVVILSINLTASASIRNDHSFASNPVSVASFPEVDINKKLNVAENCCKLGNIFYADEKYADSFKAFLKAKDILDELGQVDERYVKDWRYGIVLGHLVFAQYNLYISRKVIKVGAWKNLKSFAQTAVNYNVVYLPKDENGRCYIARLSLVAHNICVIIEGEKSRDALRYLKRAKRCNCPEIAEIKKK